MSDPLIADRLGPGWYPLESGFRWMSRVASVRMPGPRTAAQRLYLTAICPSVQLTQGPLDMTVAVDGIPLAPVRYTKGNVLTTFDFPLPPAAAGQRDLNITLTLSRTIHFGADQRDLGVAFGRLEIK
jgi:hypothetical protein